MGKVPFLNGKVPVMCCCSRQSLISLVFVLQEKLDGYLQYMKGEIERQAKFNPDRFDDSLSKWLLSYVHWSMSV